MAVAYRRGAPARRPARRKRKYRNYALSRSLTFGPGALVPFAGWIYEREPLRWAGLAAMELAGLLVIPVTVLIVLFVLPAMLRGGLVPNQWRINHRKRHGRANCKSAVITESLRRVVYAADRHRCLYCGITARELAALPPRVGKDGIIRPRTLHVDHWKPWQPGGLTTLFNLSTLCDEHNEIKLNYWRQRNGYVWYRPSERNQARLAQAAQISAAIRWRRWSPFRLWRAAWALG
jgi:hypothetical protein